MAADFRLLTEIPVSITLAIIIVVFVGSVLQATFGFGLGVLAGPFLLLVAPDLMPETLLVATLGLPLFTLRSEGAAADTAGLRWALLGRVPGMLLGACLLSIIHTRALGVLVSVSVLVSVAVSMLMRKRRLHIRRNAFALTIAGGVSGFTGTTVAVGGPPMALLYQDQPGARVRATLALYFLVGAVLSLVTIGLFGILSARAVVFGLGSMPIVAVAHYATRRVRARLDSDRIRLGVFAICGLAAVILLVESLLFEL